MRKRITMILGIMTTVLCLVPMARTANAAPFGLAPPSPFLVPSFQIKGSLNLRVVSCGNQDDSGRTVLDVHSEGETVTAGPISFAANADQCLEGEFLATGTSYRLSGFSITGPNGPIFQLPILSGDIRRIARINPEIAQVINSPSSRYSNWDVCNHLDYYITPPSHCTQLITLANSTQIGYFQIPLSEFIMRPIPKLSGLATISVEDETGQTLMSLTTDTWEGAFPTSKNQDGTITVTFHEGGVLDNVRYGPGGGTLWTFASPNINQAIQIEDTGSHIKLTTRIGDEIRGYRMYGHNNASSLVYGANGWRLEESASPLVFPLAGTDEILVPKPTERNALAAALATGTYLLSFVDDEGNQMSGSVQLGISGGRIPMPTDLQDVITRDMLAAEDRFIVETSILNEDTWQIPDDSSLTPEEIEARYAPYGGLKPVTIPGISANLAMIRWPNDKIRLVFMAAFLSNGEEGASADLSPYVVVNGGEAVITLSNTLTRKSSNGKDLLVFYGSMDVDTSQSDLYDYEIRVAGQTVASGTDVPVSPAIATINSRLSSANLSFPSTQVPIAQTDITICLDGDPTGTSAMVYIDRTGDGSIDDKLSLAFDGASCYSGSVVLSSTQSEEGQSIQIIPIVYDSTGAMLTGYPSGTGYAVNMPRDTGIPVGGEITVSTDNLSATKQRINVGVALDLGQGWSAFDNQMALYFGINKPGQGLLYITNGGIGVSAQKAPFAIITSSTDTSQTFRKTLSTVIDLADDFGLRFPGNYHAIIELQSGDQTIFAMSRAFSIN